MSPAVKGHRLQLSVRKEQGRAFQALGIGAVLVVVVGLFSAEDLADLPAFFLVAAAAFLPSLLWVRAGARGIPILQAFALLHIVYFALPMVSTRDLLAEFTRSEIARAGGTVFLFLVVAALSSQWFTERVRAAGAAPLDLFSETQMVSFTFMGLALGLAYQVALISGALDGLGGFLGLLRSVISTALVVACYFLGVARARGLLRGASWTLAIAGLCGVIALAWSSFFLVTGVAFILAAGLGFIITRKRIPWITVAVVFVVVSILHAGKAEMRAKYWERGTNSGGVYSVAQLPDIAAEWVSAGVRERLSGSGGQSAIDRTSLLPLLLRAQRLTPQHIDFLKGDTYALLPGMLVPRFLSPGKTASQAGMDLLNIRYGILSTEGVTSTAVGWGLIAEAWANFGYLGEIGVGLFVGLLAGALSRWSAGASPVSRPTLFAIAAMITLLNLEADLAGLLTSLLQSFAAVLIFLGFFEFLSRRKRARLMSRSPRFSQTGPRA